MQGRARHRSLNIVSNSLGGKPVDTSSRDDKDCVVWSETLQAYIHEPRASKEDIVLTRNTSSNWTSTNPVLAAGQEGYETDTRKRKVGDGVTAWNDLDYDVAGSESGGLASMAPVWFYM